MAQGLLPGLFTNLIILSSRGIDLNCLFDETKALETIGNNLPAQLEKLQQELKEKDDMIQLLMDALELRNQKIEKMEALTAKKSSLKNCR